MRSTHSNQHGQLHASQNRTASMSLLSESFQTNFMWSYSGPFIKRPTGQCHSEEVASIAVGLAVRIKRVVGGSIISLEKPVVVNHRASATYG